MSPPPSTPTPRRFLLPKRAPQSQSTPRFAPPSSVPRPSQLRRGVEDVDDDDDDERVEASSVEDEDSGDGGGRGRDVLGDAIEVESEATGEGGSASPDSRDGRGPERSSSLRVAGDSSPPERPSPIQREAKRRKLSISPMTTPTKTQVCEHEDLGNGDRGVNYDDQSRGSFESGHGDYPSDMENKDRAQQQPTFRPPPRFKALDEESPHHEGLPAAFSPQRRGAKYLTGGLAAELQGWLSEVKDEFVGSTFRFIVQDVRLGRRMYLVSGKMDNSEEHTKLVLAGEGRLTGLGKRAVVGVGSVVEVGQPVWDIELDGETWVVACDWTIS